jgi:hypothetical protein
VNLVFFLFATKLNTLKLSWFNANVIYFLSYINK